MDDGQTNHLKAYGIAYDAVRRGGHTEWLLNYRGGTFLVPDDAVVRRAATLAGVAVESVSDAQLVEIRGTIEAGNMDAVMLERAPRVAIYAPPFAPPWDDAVTMALQYADIPVHPRVGPRGARRRALRTSTGSTCTTRTSRARTRSST